MSNKYIEVYFITKKHCFKCENAKPLVKSLDNHPNIAVIEVPSEILSKEYIKRYNLKTTPVLMIFVNGEYKGNVEKGFTSRNIVKQLKELVKIEIPNF